MLGRGIYYYSVLIWDAETYRRTFMQYKMRVEVLAEKGNRYQIKYKGLHARTQSINTIHWVRKDKVKLDIPEVKPAQQLELRLPYKDNE